MRFFARLLIALSLCISLSSCEEKSIQVFQESDIQIIPKVENLKINTGVFTFNKNTAFVIPNESNNTAAKVLIDKFNKCAGWNLQILKETPISNFVFFKNDEKLEQEAYTLSISKNEITISASSYVGYLYGVQSLRQLLPIEIESLKKIDAIDWEVPSVTIKDSPRFKWRGLMLDLSRHFFSKDYIKQTIDALSLHKMNVLHLHLVDDQGWRIEIKKYPKLTEVGAWRVDQEHLPWNSRTENNTNQKGTYGGFLTQEDLKEIVAYATLKGIEVIPEIEMPAHVSSAIAAYPSLSCKEKPIAVPSGALWPITDIYCAGKESTFHFLEDVLSEVMEIFPSKYIHIGGDEATKTNWETCSHCNKRMENESLKNTEELQSYFIKRIETYINSKGKKLIGWDEILEGGLAPDATVMSWRGVAGGIEAAKHGNDAIMTPVSHCYFDYYQGPPELEPIAGGSVLSTSKVYTFEPVAEGLTEKEAKHILGGQANLWAEHIPTEEHSQYMIFPRLTALSETLWSTKESRNWENFSKRLKTMLKRYDILEVNYAKSAYIITSKASTDINSKSITLTLHNEFADSDIRYSLDGAALDKNATKFKNSISIKKTTTIKASMFQNETPIGNVFMDTITFHKAVSNQVNYRTKYHERYQGSGAYNLVNTLRGTTNFRDGRWQSWLNNNAEFSVNLKEEKTISQVILGSMENQKNGIFFPTRIEVWISENGSDFTKIKTFNRLYSPNKEVELREFKLEFEPKKTRFVKIKVGLSENSRERGEGWLFLDEILID